MMSLSVILPGKLRTSASTHRTVLVRSCERISWQAKAPAPPARKSFGSNVGQALSPANPTVHAIFSQLLSERPTARHMEFTPLCKSFTWLIHFDEYLRFFTLTGAIHPPRILEAP
jgi:hypothetical protein